MLAVPLRATALVSQSADTTVSGNSPRKSHALLQRAVGEPVSHLRSCNSSFEDSSPLIPHHVIMCLIDQLLIHSIVGDFFAVTCTGRGLQWERVCYVLWKEIWETPVHGCTWTRNPQHSLANRHTQLLKLVKMKSENQKNHQKWGPRWCDMNSLCARLSKKNPKTTQQNSYCVCVDSEDALIIHYWRCSLKDVELNTLKTRLVCSTVIGCQASQRSGKKK